MDRRVDLVTARVTDVESATRYYVEGLGWEPLLSVPGEVTFFQIAPGQALSLFDAVGFDADLAGRTGVSATLSQIVATEAEVDDVVASMATAGATVLKAPQRAVWGGYHALVADPSGICWEIAHNPGWSVGTGGEVTVGPVDPPDRPVGSSADGDVHDNPAANRFETTVDGHLAELVYVRSEGQVELKSTKVPEELGGRGLGGTLVRAAVASARADGRAVLPTCPFARRWIEGHPDEVADITIL